MLKRVRFILLLMLFLLQAISQPTAQAADFTVTTVADGNDGTCNAAHCTLREAIIAANSSVGPDTITLPAGAYALTIGGAGEDAAATGDLDITDSLTLTGNGAGESIIDASALGDRLFHVHGGAVAISALTIQGGAVTGAGGGLLVEASGELTLEGVQVLDNAATGNGGGINAIGRLTVLNSTVAGNSSDNAGGGVDANLLPASGSTIIVRNSTFSDNSALEAGAIGSGTNTPLLVENSTLSGNRAVANGGALRSYGSVTISASTLTTNRADSNDDGVGTGGALYAEQGSITFQTSIIAGNERLGAANDCAAGSGAFASLGYNLFINGTGCATVASDLTVAPTDVFASVLLPLGDHGGATLTHQLLPGSPAIDVIPVGVNGCGTSLTADQRGVARPSDGDADGVARCDVGAVEVSVPNPPVLLQATSGAGGLQLLGRLYDLPTTTVNMDFYGVASCDASGPTAVTTLIGSSSATTDDAGNVYFTANLATAGAAPLFVAAIAQRFGSASGFSACVAVGPNNVSWPAAHPLSLAGDPQAPSASISHFIDRRGQSRWYKFSVQPNSELVVTLTDLPADYNITLFKDIAAAYEQSVNSTEDLILLNAEFAPEAFSPEAFSPEAFSPEAFSPEAFSPEAFSPEAFSPLVFSPEAFSPEAFSPEAFSPEAFSPEAFSPEAFSPEAFSPEAFSPEAFSPEAFSPEAFSSAQMRSVIGVSAFSGLASEGLLLKTWNNSGDFYVRVSGRNGAFSLAAPFQLTVTLLTGECSEVSPALPATSLNVTGAYDTLILTDWSRLPGSSSELATLQSRLATLGARQEVRGAVINVGLDQRVAAANEQADENPACPYAKNLVAESIEQIIDNYWEDHSSLKYLVLVGGDEVIPFFRHPDQALLAPEQNYHPPVLDNTASQASLRLSYLLSQDRYGSRVDLSGGAYVLPISELAVGRLVETPSEIVTMLDAYLSTNGGVVPTPSSALVTGYDFLWDAALAVQTEMEAGLGEPVDTLLNTPDISPASPQAWTAEQLRAALLDSRHDLIFLAGHFSASGALAADYRTRLSAQEVATSGVNLTNALIFSAGCHSGYNVVNGHAVPGVTEVPDWAQAFAQKGATFIGGTGYQYGDTDFVEYSERLYVEFASALRHGTGPVAVGEALTAAKIQYLAETPAMRGIHVKSLLQATLFGLPMLKVDLPAGRGTPPSDSSIVTSTTPFSSNPGAALALRAADVTVEPSLTSETVTLQNIAENSTVEATYWSGSDGVVTNPAEPVLPLESYNVTVQGRVLRGVGFRGGAYTDNPNILPLTGAPATEIRGVHAPFLSSVFYPQRPWTVNYFDALADPASGATRLFVTPLQHRSSSANPTLSTARLFEQMDLRLYYSSYTAASADGHEPALAAPPTISSVSSEVEGGTVRFLVRVTGDPAAGIQEVWVTYSADSGPLAGQWQSLDLTQHPSDSTLWEGTLSLGSTAATALRYVAQAVNGVGLVTMATNHGSYYSPGSEPGAPPDPGAPPPEPTTLTVPSAPSSGTYGSTVSVQSRLRSSNGGGIAGQPVRFILGTQQRTALTNSDGYATVELPLYLQPGAYDLRASFAGSDQYSPATSSVSFTINKQPTVLSLEPTHVEAEPGAPIGMVATLQDGLGRVLREKSVFFVVGNGVNQYSTSVITDYAGRAFLNDVPLPTGSYVVNVYYEGTIPLPSGPLTLSNPLYLPSSTSGSLLLNRAPQCDTATPSTATLWPPNHLYRSVSISGVSDPDGHAVTLAVNSIFQDEAVNAPGSGQTAPDGRIMSGGRVQLRAERVEGGNGRVYHVAFTARDTLGGSCQGEVLVAVPNTIDGTAIDDGALYNSTVIP